MSERASQPTTSSGGPLRGGPFPLLSLLTALLTLSLGLACSGSASVPAGSAQGPSDPVQMPDPGGAVRTFDLVAAPLELQLKPGLREHAWAYNGQVPGPTIRVRAGDLVQVTLHNRLPVPTTIHWHGISLPNGQDGVAGLTQDATPPGATVTYSFVPRTPGTYWYHSHEHGAEQVDRGLYGALLVDPAEGPAEGPADGPTATDATLVLDEWPLGLSMPRVPAAGDFNLVSYTTYSVNGRAGPAIAPVTFTPGRPLRLRLINAGYLVHFVHLDGVAPAIAAFDGHEVAGGPPTAAAIPIGPGERVDLVWTPTQATALRLEDSAPPAEEAVVPILPAGQGAATSPAPRGHPVLDLFRYAAAAAAAWPAGAQPDRDYRLELGEQPIPPSMKGMNMGGGLLFTINGAAFPDTALLDVSPGELVRLTLVNTTRVEHSIHLHGHAFQLLSRNGAPAAGVILKDTVLVLPGDTVAVGFRADNPGWWMIHCHQLLHSMAGMMAIVRYTGSSRKSRLGGRFDSVPD